MAAKNSFVLDSFAVIGFLENEEFASRIEKILRKARQGKILVFSSSITSLDSSHMGSGPTVSTLTNFSPKNQRSTTATTINEAAKSLFLLRLLTSADRYAQRMPPLAIIKTIAAEYPPN